jgi:nitrogen fixation protein NifX
MSQLADINRVAELEVDANKLIVAFANSDGEIVNQHFGSSLGFHAWQYRYTIGG